MEKFHDVKVGDTVFVPQTVSYDWNKAKSFFIPKKVIKTTKTQFTVEPDIRFKNDGKMIGGGYGEFAYKEGDKYGYRLNEVVKDERNEMRLFREKLNLETEIRNIISSIKLVSDSDLTNGELLSIKTNLESIKKMIEK
jgi:hypothetical protein